jgi:hypothetical protein
MTEDTIDTTSATRALKLVLRKRTVPDERRRLPVVVGKIGDDFFEREQNRLDTLRQLIVP